MRTALKYVHIIAFAGFLGSIAVYTAISIVSEGAGVVETAFARKIISVGTAYITIPCMWFAVLSGLAMVAAKPKLMRNTRLWAKMLIGLLVVVNTYTFIAPAIDQLLAVTAAAISGADVANEVKSAYMRESVAGAINVLMILTAAFLGLRLTAPKS
ncbi:MAG: hypothetical protein HY751_10180 [Nitrospinae bacterium]|nr:hypothetical protein [Nitrospinota bacterium]